MREVILAMQLSCFPRVWPHLHSATLLQEAAYTARAMKVIITNISSFTLIPAQTTKIIKCINMSYYREIMEVKILVPERTSCLLRSTEMSSSFSLCPSLLPFTHDLQSSPHTLSIIAWICRLRVSFLLSLGAHCSIKLI